MLKILSSEYQLYACGKISSQALIFNENPRCAKGSSFSIKQRGLTMGQDDLLVAAPSVNRWKLSIFTAPEKTIDHNAQTIQRPLLRQGPAITAMECLDRKKEKCMTDNAHIPQNREPRPGFTGTQVLLMVALSMAIAALVTFFALRLFLFPPPFKPVILSAGEEQQLSQKIEKFSALANAETGQTEHQPLPDSSLQPEKYSEEGASREINFTERELNALLAKNTDLATKLAVDLAADTISIKLLIPLDPDLPILGGKTLKINAGAELAYRDGRPVARLHGVSLMGVPMPNSWLGGIKNVDLVKEFGADEGFWKAFADGVEAISVGDGFLNIRLKE
jgi:hypothetical protein